MGAAAVFTAGLDFALNARESYEAAAGALGFFVGDVICAHQRHTDNVLLCDRGFLEENKDRLPLPEGFVYDAMVTDVPGVLLSVRSADCVPALFWDGEHGAVGAAHCGWRGTLQKLQQKTALEMQKLYKTDLGHLRVAMGPCIQKCCYEVSGEFRENFLRVLGGRVEPYFAPKGGGKHMCDLPGINVGLLSELFGGENIGNIEVSKHCTCCGEGFFSHRRQGERRGTHAAFIGLKTI